MRGRKPINKIHIYKTYIDKRNIKQMAYEEWAKRAHREVMEEYADEII